MIDITTDLEHRIEGAAARQGVTVPEYVRMLLERAVSPESSVPKKHGAGREELRRAAEAAREYYATDPEALELADFVGDDTDE